MTQKQLVMAYVQEFGEIVPARVGGTNFMGEFFGSETSRRCRDLRKEGKLTSEGYGRFERFYLPDQLPIQEGEVITIWEQQRKLSALREQYKAETDPGKRKIIEIQGKLLRTALDMAEKDDDVKNVVEALYE